MASMLRGLNMRGRQYTAAALALLCVIGSAVTAGVVQAEEGPPPDWTAEDWNALPPEEQASERNDYPFGDGTAEEKGAWIDANPEELMDAEVDAMAEEEGAGVDFSRGVQEGAQSPFHGGTYVFQNQWQDLDSTGTSVIEVFAGSLVAEPCTGIVAINRTPVASEGPAHPLGIVSIEQFQLMGPIKVTGATGLSVRLFAADGSLGFLNAENGSIKWNYPLRPPPLDDDTCRSM
jgi:hypothetical protein